ncbi:MAG: methyltransferase domain-containing protein [Oscillospiraceae bacterium]|nr:methyltransferase domain-containing protein [Oscillospiraceae bacterium]
MAGWRCPVCGEELAPRERQLVCANGHSFDVAKQGYVNLLRTGNGLKRHGDDAAMVQSRRAFLEKGFYAPIRDAVVRAAAPFAAEGLILDAGCGEGYYTEAVSRVPGALVWGTDISREAAKACGKRGISCAVATSARLPLKDGAAKGVMCLFAPLENREFARILQPGGKLVLAVPLREHLWELKAAVYDTPYENPDPCMTVPGFRLSGYEDVREMLHLTENGDILTLFRMTPYWYKTGRKDQEKLDKLTALDTRIAVRVAVYEKES